MENYRMTYTVDLVFCIDCTNSMGPCIDMVKESAIRFYDDLVQALQNARKHIEGIRVKIVAFHDYLSDSEPMQVTDFFVLPQQKKEFTDTVRGIVEYGGGDEPEDRLEALAYAIRSDWSKEGTKNVKSLLSGRMLLHIHWDFGRHRRITRQIWHVIFPN